MVRIRLRPRLDRMRNGIRTLQLVYRHPRTPAYAKWWLACVLAYALSPIDLIPDFVPVVGYLDDLVILPLGIWLAFRMVPPEVVAECRARAAAGTTSPGR